MSIAMHKTAGVNGRRSRFVILNFRKCWMIPWLLQLLRNVKLTFHPFSTCAQRSGISEGKKVLYSDIISFEYQSEFHQEESVAWYWILEVLNKIWNFDIQSDFHFQNYLFIFIPQFLVSLFNLILSLLTISVSQRLFISFLFWFVTVTLKGHSCPKTGFI